MCWTKVYDNDNESLKKLGCCWSVVTCDRTGFLSLQGFHSQPQKFPGKDQLIVMRWPMANGDQLKDNRIKIGEE